MKIGLSKLITKRLAAAMEGMLKIIGILLQRNEIDVILFSALHHLRCTKLDRLIIGDNGSTDGSKEVLRLLEKTDPRLMVVDMPGIFEQAERVNNLYQLALDLGADWVIPLDADEFLPLDRRSLESLLLGTKDSAVRMDMVNFVQRRQALIRRMHNIATMLYFAPPSGMSHQAMELVSSGQIGFAESIYPPKYIWRANKNLYIMKGNHGANIDLDDISNSIALNHVQLRDKASITARKRIIERLEIGPDTDSWHIKRLAHVDIDEEWRRNSFKRAALDVNGERHRVTFNAFFLKIFLKYCLTVRHLVRSQK